MKKQKTNSELLYFISKNYSLFTILYDLKYSFNPAVYNKSLMGFADLKLNKSKQDTEVITKDTKRIISELLSGDAFSLLIKSEIGILKYYVKYKTR